MLLETCLWLHVSPEWRAVIKYPKHCMLAHPTPMPCSSKKLAEAAPCCSLLWCAMFDGDAVQRTGALHQLQ